ncbi:hypothetical protein ABMA59_30690, partial [Mesorhizobium sp. CN2-181]
MNIQATVCATQNESAPTGQNGTVLSRGCVSRRLPDLAAWLARLLIPECFAVAMRSNIPLANYRSVHQATPFHRPNRWFHRVPRDLPEVAHVIAYAVAMRADSGGETEMVNGIGLPRAGFARRFTPRPVTLETTVHGWLPPIYELETALGRARKRLFSCDRPPENVSSRNALHALIVSALGLCGAGIASQAQASCSGAADQNLSAGNYGYTWSICNGAAGTDSKDEKDGAWGDNITITSEGTYATSAGVPPYSLPGGVVGGVFMTYSRGGDGVDEGNAGGGGSVSITTHNSITVNGSGNSGYLGSMISAYSWGGNGDSDNDNNDSNGGDGGAGSSINVTNYGTMTIDGTVSPLSGGMYGIIAVSGGGTGGEQNNSVSGLGDQVGGDGGSSGSVTVTNAGTISIGSTSSRMQGNAAGAGIYADSGGGGGG